MRCITHIPTCAYHVYKPVSVHDNKTNININNPNIKKIIPNNTPINRNISMTAGTRLPHSAWAGLWFCTPW